MNYFDPARPANDGIARSVLVPSFALPKLYIEPSLSNSGEIEWLVTVNLPTSAGAFHAFGANVASERVGAFLAGWLADPEHEMLTTFGYDYNAKHLRAASRKRVGVSHVAASLAALGLGD